MMCYVTDLQNLENVPSMYEINCFLLTYEGNECNQIVLLRLSETRPFLGNAVLFGKILI